MNAMGTSSPTQARVVLGTSLQNVAESSLHGLHVSPFNVADALPPQYRILSTYSVSYFFDMMITFGCLMLGICYAIARHYNHIGTFCDISDLVVHLPERVLFRLNFSIVGGCLFLSALPIRDIVRRRVSGELPNAGATFQILSGLGVILVGGCGPTECQWFHAFAAALGFAGSAIAQMIYGIALRKEDQPTPGARALFVVRCCISGAFVISAVIYGLGQARVFPEPTEHIFEWVLWFLLLIWYYTFRFDMARPGENFYLATVNQVIPGSHLAPLQGIVVGGL